MKAAAGIAITQRSLAPHSEGLLYALYNDSYVKAYRVKGIVSALLRKAKTQSLFLDREGLSVSRGGRAQLKLIAEKSSAKKFAVMLAGLSGTSPGLAFGAAQIPINWDALTSVALGLGNTAPMLGFQRTLD